MNGQVDPNTPGAWVVERGRTLLGAEWIDGALHPVIEQSGVLSFYEHQRVSGGGGQRRQPDPVVAYAIGQWETLRRAIEPAS